MKKFTTYTIATIIAMTVLVFVTAVMDDITDGFYYFFDDAGCTIGALLVAALGCLLNYAIYYVAGKINKKMEEKEMKKKMEEYSIIAEAISKKLGL